MRTATYPVSQLDLDKQNPRINAVENQTAALQELLSVEKDAEKIYALASNICGMSMLDPGDRLYVVPSTTEPDRYIVLDGNRRLAALRLLSQATLLDRDDIGLSSVIRQRLKRLQRDQAGRWPTEVDVVVFNNRQDANEFIRLRHTGENAGAGRSAWSALQVARFDNTRTWQCLEQLRHDNALDLEAANALDRGEFAITNFERVANVAAFQTRFGYSLASTFSVIGPKERAYKALSKVASDVVSGRVHSREEFAESKNMARYFDEVENFVNTSMPTVLHSLKGPDPIGLSRTSVGRNSSTSKDSSGQSHVSAPSPSPSHASVVLTPPSAPVRKRRTSTYLVDKKVLLNVTNIKCRLIIEELKGKVKVTEAPIACALLLRSFQEMTAYMYLEAIGQSPGNNKTTNITAAANHLLGNSHPTDTSDWRNLALAFKSSSDVYEKLCETAHSTVTATGPDHVRVAWENLSGGLDLLWRRIHYAEATLLPTSESMPARKKGTL